MSALVGLTLNSRYRVEEYIGGGGMADVYKVWDEKRSCYMAIKVMRQSLSELEEFGERFKREADVLARLQHPNIVRFYGVEEYEGGGSIFIVMDYVDGPTLATKLKTSRHPPSTSEMVPLVDDIAAALTYAHEHGIVHRDIKPSNILISRDGRGLLSDFGIAHLSDAMTMTYHGLGTPAYMSPEHCEGKELIAASDVYSLGVVLYESLAGRRPFIGDLQSGESPTSANVMREQIEMAPPAPTEINPGIRREVEAVLLKCLAKDPQYRYQSAADLASELHRASGVKVVPALRVVSIPGGAEVKLDGRVVGVTPLEVARLGPGAHTVKVVLKGYQDYQQTIQSPDQSVVEARLEAVPHTPLAVPGRDPEPQTTALVREPGKQSRGREAPSGGSPPPPVGSLTAIGAGGHSRRLLLLGGGLAVALAAALGVALVLLMSGGDPPGPSPSDTSTGSPATSRPSRTPTSTPRATPVPGLTPPAFPEPPFQTSGEITSAGVPDKVTFGGEKDMVVTIEMKQEGSAALNPYLRLLDPGGEVVNENGCNNGDARLLNVPLPATGEYTIELSGCNDSVGGYTMLLQRKPQPATIKFGDSPASSIQIPDDYVDFLFVAEANDIVTIRVQQDGSAALNSEVALYDSGGAELKRSGCNSEGIIRNEELKFAGTYRIRVTSCSGTTGGFKLTLGREPASKPIQYGGKGDGQITVESNYDAWIFSGQQNDVVTILVQQRGSATLQPRIRLLDPGGAEADEGGCGSVSTIENHVLRFTGSYRIIVTGCSESMGEYSISIDKESAGP